jgi:putative transposase
MGMIIGLVVLPANCADELGAKTLLRRLPLVLRWALFIFDAGYDKVPFIHWCETIFGVVVEIKRRLSDGFQVLPKRWIVERTFAWLNTVRRLSKDYEERPNMSENMIYMAMIHLMLKRLHPK